jgi:vacuolar iron transporter family protein
MKLRLPKDPSKFSFGATSSTVTSLGIIFGLLTSGNPQASVIGSLLVIAVADNIADSLGIHIYRESTRTQKENTRMFTISNFITRFGITLTFVALFAFLPINYAAVACTIIGMSILVFLSYLIGVQTKTSTLREMLIHLGIAIPVIIISHFLGQLIFSIFG